jgi:hypothetical protein
MNIAVHDGYAYEPLCKDRLRYGEGDSASSSSLGALIIDIEVKYRKNKKGGFRQILKGKGRYEEQSSS